MNGFGSDMVKTFLTSGKHAAITEYAKILYPDKRNVIVDQYDGDCVRLYTESDAIHVMCPTDMSGVVAESVAEMIATGDVFDNADDVDNNAQFVTLNSAKQSALINKGIDQPKNLRIVISGIIGRMSDDGTIEISVADLDNGKQFVDQLKTCDPEDSDKIDGLVDHYLGAKDHQSLPRDLKKVAGSGLRSDLKDITSVNDDDVLKDDDYEWDKLADDDDSNSEEYEHKDDDHPYEEAFFSKKPKKLKPIPRSIIAYITVEKNDIQDANDQAMLSGYTCSKLDLVEFYLNVIDCQDERYIVPHPREYLVWMQKELTRLLNEILKMKPVNRSNNVWQYGVTLPQDWRG